jgi:DNA polymerase
MPEFPDSDARNVLEPGCERCPALAECRERIAWGNGSMDADLLVAGEAPAAGDASSRGLDGTSERRSREQPDATEWRGGNWTGMAYTSRHSGQRVRDLVADLGFDSANCYFTNAVKCHPCDGKGSNREPTPAERRNCRVHLETEIREVEPAVVVATGKHATLAVLGDDALDGGFLDAVLDPVESDRFGVTVVPVLHPSYQEVWLSRLGYDYEGYVAEMRAQVEATSESD